MSDLHFSPRPNRAAEINWQPWGETAFESAKAQGKPMLLAISAVWCHWCHVMDETSYSDGAVIQTINERFIPVRVDNDQRPDVNARYNMGGWPTTALLTPDGDVLYGGTYIPPDAMRQVLAHVDRFYTDPSNRLTVAQKVSEMKAARAGRARAPEGGELDPHTAAKVLALLSSAFDEEYGGFGTDQKFPHVPALQFLLDFYAREHNERAKTIVERTLRGMAGGGMYDHVEGGFFRYSTTPDFSVPHFEKMLEDLGGLLLVCARASALFEDASIGAVAMDVKRYMDARLWNDEAGGYGGSQDADEKYFELDAQGRAAVPAPYVDKTLYAAWNAQVARSLILGAPLAQSAGADANEWTQRGLAILETLWNRMLDRGLMCRYFDGSSAHIRGLLVDQVWCAWAALAAFSATGEVRWLDRAGDLIGHSDALYDADAHVYLDRLKGPDDAGRLAEQTVSVEENALMARALLDFASLSGKSVYAERGQAILRHYARDYQAQNIFAAGYASAVLDALEPPIDVNIVGPARDPVAVALRDAALRIASPPLRPNPIDPAAEPQRASSLGYDAAGVTAYLCRGKMCFARVTSPHELKTALTSNPVSST